MDGDNAIDEVKSTIAQLLETENDEERRQNLQSLLDLCSKGSEYQEAMATHGPLNVWLHEILFSEINPTTDRKQQSLGWQLLGSLTVSNSTGQREVYKRHGRAIVGRLLEIFDKHTSAQLFIVYNILIGDTRAMPDTLVLCTCVRVWQRMLEEEEINKDVEYLHSIFEYFVTGDPQCTVRCYNNMEIEDRLSFLDYVANYIREGSPNGLFTDFMLKYICTTFKSLTRGLVRDSFELEQWHCLEIRMLLKLIANATGCEKYDHVFVDDHNLFPNVCTLLCDLLAAGQEHRRNANQPMNGLDEVEPDTKITNGFESDVSLSLKLLLIRCIANLLYNNKTNQLYCLDTNFMPALFECSTMDTRNPLMRKWSLLAIRNACDDCIEIQNIVEDLSQQRAHYKDFVSEINLEMGSMRI